MHSWSGYGHVHGTALAVSTFFFFFFGQTPSNWWKDKMTFLPDLPLNTQLILQLVKATDPNNKKNLLTHGIQGHFMFEVFFTSSETYKQII
jgi:hypothetical protein